MKKRHPKLFFSRLFKRRITIKQFKCLLKKTSQIDIRKMLDE